MKKKKEKISDNVCEAVIEIIFTIVFGFIGLGICLFIGKIFPINLDNFDLNSFVLIGIIALFVIMYIVGLVIHIIKKRNKKEK